MDKGAYRNKYKKLRDELPAEENKKLSTRIFDNIINSSEYIEAKKIFIFVNTKSEIETLPIIIRAFEDDKIVAVPKMTGKAHDMVFIEIESLEELTYNKYGILEPRYAEDRVSMADEQTLMIVPALAVDNRGYRIGYGGGYYDKYMAENGTLANIAIAFDFQIVDSLPYEEYDIAVDGIITEGGRIK